MHVSFFEASIRQRNRCTQAGVVNEIGLVVIVKGAAYFHADGRKQGRRRRTEQYRDGRAVKTMAFLS